MITFTISFALMVLLHLGKAGDPCPPPEELRFCTCTRNETASQNKSIIIENSIAVNRKTSNSSYVIGLHPVFTSVECNVTRTISALEEAIAVGLHRRQVDKLTVYRVPSEKEHTLARLPEGWLKNTRVRHLELLNSKFSGDFIWHGNPFEGQEQSLLILTVKNCSLYGALTHDTVGTVNTKKLDSLPNIEIIDFSQNLLTVITTSAFQKHPANLSTIILSRNSIEQIDSGAFKNVLHLKKIDLSHNMLKSVARGIFAAPARFLETMDLSWNFLKVLPVDFFTNLPSLKNINLEKNFLYSMPEKPWRNVWAQLSFINIEGNFINCDCNLLWLTHNAPSSSKATVKPVSTPKVLKGKCSYYRLPFAQGKEYSLDNLKKESLMCNI